MLLGPALFLLLGASLVWPELETSDPFAGSSTMAFDIGFEVLYYWRLIHHVRELAVPEAQGGPGAMERMSADPC